MSDSQAPRRHGAPHEGLAFAEALARLLAEGRRVAVATVVRGKGSHPRAPGSKMLVPDEGPTLLSVGGGALEAAVIADCRALLAGLDMGEAGSAKTGPPSMSDESRGRSAGESGGRGAGPRWPASSILPRETALGHARGGTSLGGDMGRARSAKTGPPSVSGIRRYELSESGDDAVGMTCGGSVEVFLDVEEPPQRLFIFGAGHVGRAVAAAARIAGLALTMVDDRQEWLDPAAFPPGTALHRCTRDYTDALPHVPGTALAVVMTRCHDTDVAVMQHLSREPPRHVGMMGSRRKVLRAFEVLRERGVDDAWLQTVRAPIGLTLGAETPGEIAISVIAEIVSVLRGARP